MDGHYVLVTCVICLFTKLRFTRQEHVSVHICKFRFVHRDDRYLLVQCSQVEESLLYETQNVRRVDENICSKGVTAPLINDVNIRITK